MFSSKREFWTEDRVRWILRSLATIVLFGVLLQYIRDCEEARSIRRGDFPAFYAAAVAYREYGGAGLYDTSLHYRLQQHYWPSLRGSFAPFHYPPYVALLIEPLALFGPAEAQLIFFGVMILACLLAVYLMSKVVLLMQSSYLDALAGLILFAPVLSGIFASQNTALSLLCYAGVLSCAERRTPRGEYMAGVFSGLWLFKPQYPAVLLILSLLARRRRFLLGALVPALVYFLLGVYVLGPLWPARWLEVLEGLHGYEVIFNAHQHVGLKGVFTAAAVSLGLSEGLKLFQTAALLLASIIFFLAAKAFFEGGSPRPPESLAAGKGLVRADFAGLLYLTGPLALVVLPHAAYYDTALCAFPFARFFRSRSDRAITALGLVYLFAFYCASNRHLLSLNPLAVLPLATMLFVVRSLSIAES